MDQKVMDAGPYLGSVNGHIVGRLLKEAMMRAFSEIDAVRMSFEITEKQGFGGKMDDMFTTADKNAQETYLRMFRECLPEWGVIGEENKLRIEPKNGCGVYATIDPLDGTKAFVREASTGVGSMVAVVSSGKVISAYIGDVNTKEIYGYRPGSDKVHRIHTDINAWKELPNPADKVLAKSYVLLRDPPEKYSAESRALLPRFKNYEVSGGSIGIWFARLWKGEVGALLLKKGKETPWDSTPVIGISQKLGYEFLQPANGSWEIYDPKLPLEPYNRNHDTFVAHWNNLDQFFERSSLFSNEA